MEKSWVEKKVLINTSKKFKLKTFLNKKNMKKKSFYFFKYKSFLLTNSSCIRIITKTSSFILFKALFKFNCYHHNKFNFLNFITINYVIKYYFKKKFIQNIIHLYNYIFIKTSKSSTNAQRFKQSSYLIKYKPFLTFFKKCFLNKAGRNNCGIITVYSKGIKKKSNTVIISKNVFWTKKLSFVHSIIRNKNKLYNINKHVTGSFSLTPYMYGSEVGQYNFVSNLPKNFWINPLPGSLVLLKFITRYTIISNIYINNIRKFGLANGTFAQVLEIFYDYNLVKVVLPSKNVKFLSGWDFAILGRNSQINYKFNVLGKAGVLYLFGKKPKVRGVARNPVDHPHGGRTKTNQPEVSIWGWVAKKNK